MARSEIVNKFSDLDDDFSIESLSPRERKVVETKNNRGSSTNNKSVSNYLSQPHVKEFNKELRKKVFNSSGFGRPYAFQSVEKLESDLNEYFDLCARTTTTPTITSLALWLGVDKTTIYEHANNSNSPFSTILKNCVTYCHSIMQDGTIDGKVNPVAYIFISKNDYGMRDDKNVTITPNSSNDSGNNQETMNAIKKQLEEENIPNATIAEE